MDANVAATPGGIDTTVGEKPKRAVWEWVVLGAIVLIVWWTITGQAESFLSD